MNRERLIKVMEGVAKEVGRQFYSGFAYRINSQISNKPTLWLMPPKLIKVDGRKEGVQHYELELQVIDQPNQWGEAEKEQQWAVMEQELGEVIGRMRESQWVRGVELRVAEVSEQSLTNRGEIALKAKLRVQMHFCATCSAE